MAEAVNFVRKGCLPLTHNACGLPQMRHFFLKLRAPPWPLTGGPRSAWAPTTRPSKRTARQAPFARTACVSRLLRHPSMRVGGKLAMLPLACMSGTAHGRVLPCCCRQPSSVCRGRHSGLNEGRACTLLSCRNSLKYLLASTPFLLPLGGSWRQQRQRTSALPFLV